MLYLFIVLLLLFRCTVLYSPASDINIRKILCIVLYSSYNSNIKLFCTTSTILKIICCISTNATSKYRYCHDFLTYTKIRMEYNTLN